MYYFIQHATPHVAPENFPEELLVSEAECIPRVGDTVTIGEADYQVIAVWHALRPAKSSVLGPVSVRPQITVRVK